MRQREKVVVWDHWKDLHPTRPNSFWIEVGRRVKRRSIRKNDLPAVTTVIGGVEKDWRTVRERRRAI